MSLADAFLCNHSQIKLLVLAEHHEADGVALLAVLLVVDDWHDRTLLVADHNALRSDFLPVTVCIAVGLHLEINRALGAHTSASALLTGLELVNVIADQRHKPETMSKELIMKSRGVLSDFDQVNGHRGHLTDHDTSKSICHGQVGLKKLKLDSVA